MDVVWAFAVIAAIIGLGFLSEIVFRKTNIPDVLFLIAIGIAIGPVLHWITPQELPGSDLFITFTLVFLLFQGALNINFHELIESLGTMLKLTLWSFIMSVIVATLSIWAFGYSFLTALLLGTMLGGTASAVVIPLVNRLKMDEKTRIVLMLESAVTDVLCIVSALMVMDIITTGVVAPRIVLESLFLSFGLAVVVGLGLGLLWILLLHKYEDLMHAYMVSIAAVVGTYALVEGPIGASGAIAALAFGLVLGNSHQLLHKIYAVPGPHHHKARYTTATDVPVIRDVLSPSARTFYSEISFFVKVFFFVYIGVLITFAEPFVFVLSGILSLLLFLVRPLAVKLVHGKHLLQRERVFLEVIVPRGLAPVALIQLAVSQGIPGIGEAVSLVVSTVVFTILLTSALVFMAEHGWFKGFWFSYWPKLKDGKKAKNAA